MTERTRLARICLRMTIVPLAACALMAIGALIFGGFDSNGWRILGTCAATAFASMAGLGCAVPYDRRMWKRLAVLGMCLSGAMWVSLLLAIWTDVFRHGVYEKIPFLLTVAAMALSHVSMLTIARLASQYRWVRVATVFVVVALAVTLSGAMILDEGDEDILRAIGILAILVALGSLTIPILHRLSALRDPILRALDTIEEVIVICPRCQNHLKLLVGATQACDRCELEINMSISAPPGESRSSNPSDEERTGKQGATAS
jgi:hypothetical protein